MNTESKLDKAIEFVANSRRELENGTVVVLEGFQNEVRDICAAISALPLEEMRQFTPKIEELMKNLNTLETELRDQQSLVQQELFKLNRKQTALKTYQTVTHSHKNEEE